MLISPFHAYYKSRELSGLSSGKDRLLAAYASSDMEVFPYQVAAALFALRSPYLRGVVLCDEGSLGKTFEAMLIIAQRRYEGWDRILVVVPTPLLAQWADVLERHFSLPYHIVDIRYVKLAGQEYYVQEVFEAEELMANLGINAVEVTKSVYDHVIYDSNTVERPFAVALDDDPDVKFFFKIPRRFKIDTLIGTYNPNWAVLLERDGNQQLYLILETKGSNSLFDLRLKESLRIHCGKEHSKALETDVSLEKAVAWQDAKIRI